MGTTEQAVADAITGLREQGFSWREIGEAVGKAKQDISQWHKRHAG